MQSASSYWRFWLITDTSIEGPKPENCKIRISMQALLVMEPHLRSIKFKNLYYYGGKHWRIAVV